MLTKFETQTKRVKGLSFHPTRPWILASLHSGTIQLWDYRIRTLVDKFEEHDGPVRGVCFHGTQPLFVSGGDDYKIKVWNYKLRRCLFTLLGHLDYIRTVQFHSESPWILSASDDQTIRIWNWQSRSCISILTGHNHYVMCAQFHPKDNLVVSASLDQTVRVWDISGLKKKNYSPTGADEGLKLPQNDLFGNTDVVILHVLEGHERGVNWAAFHNEEPLIVSAADDRQVKFWRMSETKAYEVDTLRGHLSNVSCALFHPNKPLIISNSEDKTIRVWDITRRVSVKIFRQDHDKDRFWILASHPDQNLFAAGHDSGLIVFKLEHERPAYCVYEDVVYYIKDRTLFSFNYKQNRSIASLNIRRKSGLDCGPRSLHFNPAENAILVLTDQTYDLYQLPKEGNKKEQGEAKKGQNLACFVARNRFAVLSTSSYKILVKSLDNQTTKEIPLPKDENGNPYSFDKIWPASTGCVLLRDFPKSVVLFDLQLKKITHKISASNIKFAVWSSSDKDAKLALIGRDVLVIANRQLEQLCVVHDPKLKSGAWHPNGVFIYTTLTHIKYCLPNGDTGIIRTLDVPIFIYAIAMNKIYCLDRKCRNRCLAIDGSEFMLKLAVVTGDYQQILSLVKKFGLLGQSIISYLQKKGFPELALHFVRDERTRFNLAMDCGNIEIALESAKVLDDKNCWHRLGVEALRQGNHQIVEMAYQRTKNYQRISFLYLITGNFDKLQRTMKIAEKRGDTMGRFHNALFVGDVQERVRILQQTGQIGLAYVTAITHGLQEEATPLAEKLQQTLGRIPGSPHDPKLLLPPSPVIQSSESNWPLLTVQKSLLHKMLQQEAKGSAATLEIPEEEIGDAWGGENDIFGGEEKAEPREGEDISLDIGGGEGEGWDVGDLEGLESIVPVAIKSSSAGLYVPPRPNPSPQENWVANSNLAVDHIAAGSVESAMKLLNTQAGIVNFEKLKPYFVSIFTGASVSLPSAPSISPILISLEREPGFPVVPVTLKSLLIELQNAYKLTTAGKFSESLQHFRTILHSLLFFVASKKDEETEAKELLVLAREYVTGLECELKRKDIGEANPIRNCELAAYFTHTNLQPIHLVLSLRSAMNCAYKISNFKLSASFAKRLLELNPQSAIATQARKVVAFAEQNNTNKNEINYDERNPFVLCCSTLNPIYKGSAHVTCPFCSASYIPQCAGKLCVICEVAEIGKEVTGLLFAQPRAGRR